MANKWKPPSKDDDDSSETAPSRSTGNRRSQNSGFPSKSRRLSELAVGQFNPNGLGTHEVIVSVNQANLEDLSTKIHSLINSEVEISGGQMTVSDEELKRYFVTAIYARTKWVNFQSVGPFRPDGQWALPVPMHMVVNALGEVETQPNRRYVPVWNTAGDELVLSPTEWESITRRLTALELLPNVEFIHAFEKDRKGSDVVMPLLHGNVDGQNFFYANVPPHALECLIAMVAGLASGTPVDIEGLPPQVIPVYRVSHTWVAGFMQDFSYLAV
jgi:hypothetical protein